MVPSLFSMDPTKQFFQGMFCFVWRPTFILPHVVPFFSFFHVCFMWRGIPVFMWSPLWDSVCFHISPLDFMFPLSLSLFSLVFDAPLSPWAQGPAEVFTLRRWLTIRKFDMKQMKMALKCSKDDSTRWENHITIKMKQSNKRWHAQVCGWYVLKL